MATLSDKEQEYLRGQRLAHLATVGSTGAPHVVPLGFRLAEDGSAIEVSGRGFGKTKKYRDMKANPKVAIVVDDVASVNPWKPRGIEIRGTAELQAPGGGPVSPDEPWARIKPDRIVSWGIDVTTA
jgi:pyridoxamine 5'-phosphate oxidase family protein